MTEPPRLPDKAGLKAKVAQLEEVLSQVRQELDALDDAPEEEVRGKEESQAANLPAVDAAPKIASATVGATTEGRSAAGRAQRANTPPSNGNPAGDTPVNDAPRVTAASSAEPAESAAATRGANGKSRNGRAKNGERASARRQANGRSKNGRQDNRRKNGARKGDSAAAGRLASGTGAVGGTAAGAASSTPAANQVATTASRPTSARSTSAPATIQPVESPVDTEPALAGVNLQEIEVENSGWLGKHAPGVLFSTFVHAAIVLLLGLTMMTIVQEEDKPLVVATDRVEMLEDPEPVVDLEVEEMDEPSSIQASAVTLASAVSLANLESIDKGDLGEVGAPVVGLDEIMGGDIGAFDSMGKGKASFFGVVTQGNRFVFVVDNSNSMGGGKFETACYELRRAVNGLGPDQLFYVIFFSDTAYPLFHPNAPRYMVPATNENKRKLDYWLNQVHRCLRTDGEEAMQLAFTLRPDVIYLLGDGAFGDKTVEKTLLTNVPSLTMHTLGFNMRPKDAEGFKQIATKYNGKFTEVAITPAMAALSKQMNRPKDNSRNGVWGIKLGQPKPKQKPKPKPKKKKK